MNWTENVTGLQHIGIPTNDIEKTIAFYEGLGFTVALRTKTPTPATRSAFCS